MALHINQIRKDGGTQSRAAINEATVAEYAEAMADETTVFPPVIVYFDGREYWLADGFHRLEAWRRIGRTEIPADVRQGDRRRAILHSVAANSAHGLRRTNDDKRRAVLMLLEDEEWRQWSDREIARRCAVSHTLVANLRAELSGNGCQIEMPRMVERGGTVYIQDTANIGKAKLLEPVAAPLGEPTPELPAAPHVPPRAPAADEPDAAERRRLAKLTHEALIEEALGLKAALREERRKRWAAEAEVADLKERLAAFECEDMGRALGNAQRHAKELKGRLGEIQAQLARETRRANAMEMARDAAIKKLEAQEIPLGPAA